MAENCRLCNWNDSLISYYVPKAKKHDNRIEVLLPKVKLSDVSLEIQDSKLVLQAVSHREKKRYKRNFKLDRDISLEDTKLERRGKYVHILFKV